jgi:Arc/MetJ-type ribon-helix-helix transcriptional regulator
MKYLIQRLWFSKGNGKKTSVTIPGDMLTALEELVGKTGRRSVPDVMVLLLDQVLVELAKEKIINPPKSEEQNFLNSTDPSATKVQAS